MTEVMGLGRFLMIAVLALAPIAIVVWVIVDYKINQLYKDVEAFTFKEVREPSVDPLVGRGIYLRVVEEDDDV